MAIGFLFVVHLAGVIGLIWPLTRPYFLWATPINLIVSALLLLIYHQDWNRAFIAFLVSSYLIGYLIEVIGVQTELIFGAYQYGETLGIKLAEVPLVIGVNWFILAYCAGILCYQLALPIVLRSALAATIMVALDFFIEPVAIFFDFWQWDNSIVPIRNYAGWFAVAWVIELLFFYLPFTKKNSLAPYLFFSQLFFFLILSSFV